FHGPFPRLPDRVARAPGDQGRDGEVVKSQLEPLIGILPNGVAALDDALRRDTDAVLGEKCRQAGRVLSIESGGELHVNFPCGVLIGLRHGLLPCSRRSQSGQETRGQNADLSVHFGSLPLAATRPRRDSTVDAGKVSYGSRKIDIAADMTVDLK